MNDYNFEAFSKDFFSGIMAMISASNGFTASKEDYGFNYTFPDFKSKTRENQKRLMGLLMQMAEFSGYGPSFAREFMAYAETQGDEVVLADKYTHFNEFIETMFDRTILQINQVEAGYKTAQGLLANNTTNNSIPGGVEMKDKNRVKQWNKEDGAVGINNIYGKVGSFEVIIIDLNLIKNKLPVMLLERPGDIYRSGGKYSTATQRMSSNMTADNRVYYQKVFGFEGDIDNSRTPFVPLMHKIQYAKPSFVLEEKAKYLPKINDPALALSLPVQEIIQLELINKVHMAIDRINNNNNTDYRTILGYGATSSDRSPHISTYTSFPHPFGQEIEVLLAKSNAGQSIRKCADDRVIKYNSINETPFFHIDTSEQFSLFIDLMEHSENYGLPIFTELAIDLEAHNYNSFQGFCCLMQLSTRYFDVIIDTLSLRSEIHKLGKIFANPNIVKVLHGSDSDIAWLQNDFGLYIVNLFDTFKAAKLLGLPTLSLNFLLVKYCQVDNTDKKKKFQTSDWRTRPLSKDQLLYAREDTHFLLYIYDMLRRSLIDQQLQLLRNNMKKHKNYDKTDPIASTVTDSEASVLINQVERDSLMLSLTVYQKPVWTDLSFVKIIENVRTPLTDLQLAVLKIFYDYRDHQARINDVNTGIIIPNSKLLIIAKSLPTSCQEVYSILQRTPYILSQNLDKIIDVLNSLYSLYKDSVECVDVIFAAIQNDDPSQSCDINGRSNIADSGSSIVNLAGSNQSDQNLLFKTRLLDNGESVLSGASLLIGNNMSGTSFIEAAPLVYMHHELMDLARLEPYKREKIDFIHSMVSSNFLQVAPASIGQSEDNDSSNNNSTGSSSSSSISKSAERDAEAKLMYEQQAQQRLQNKIAAYERKNFVISTSLPEVVVMSNIGKEGILNTNTALSNDDTGHTLVLQESRGMNTSNNEGNHSTMSKNKRRKLKLSELGEITAPKALKKSKPSNQEMSTSALIDYSEKKIFGKDYTSERFVQQLTNTKELRLKKGQKKIDTRDSVKKEITNFNPFNTIKNLEFKQVPTISKKQESQNKIMSAPHSKKA